MLLAHFGIDRAFTEAGGGALTRAGLLLGTPAYVSPEQAEPGQPLDAHCGGSARLH